MTSFEDEATADLLDNLTTGVEQSAAAVDESRPLADRMRPRTVEEYVGQAHLLGAGKPLAAMLERGSVHSMILWGPPGTGKTTLAGLIARRVDARFIALSAVLAGVKDVRAAVDEARLARQRGQRTVLFVDEVHRFNKAQQDAFLPHVETGLLTFIGATTENPSFEVNAALLSRARVYVLKSLASDEITELARRGATALGLDIDAVALEALVELADGDARRMYNVLDLAAQLASGTIGVEEVLAVGGEQVRRFDKSGEVYYNQISALHKAMRGSAPDASIYWFCRMLDGGADPRYVGRRLVRFASEDVGNADPRALELTLNALSTYERLGSPEGELALAQAVLYLASVPKSNAAYRAYGAAMAFVKSNPSYEVPLHIRNAPTSLMKNLGYGEGYRYAHNENQDDVGAYAAGEDYFPEEMDSQQFYEPTDAGLEAKIRTRLARLRELDAQVRSER